MGKKTNEEVLAAWMGPDYCPSHFCPDTMNLLTVLNLESRIARDLEMLNDYVGGIVGMSGEWSTEDWQTFINAPNDARVSVAADIIRRWGLAG